MIDFRELPKDGNAFELLIRELLFSRGMRAYWSGKGPDGGRDILCVEESEGIIAPYKRTWLVQCKHNAHAGVAVSPSEIGEPISSCAQHDADAYLLVCSTYPSSATVNRLEGISRNQKNSIITHYWDSSVIARLLSTPREWPLAQRFFPKSAPADELRLYGTERPNYWIANYDGYYFHLHNRIGSHAGWHLDSIRSRISDIKALDLPRKHLLRPRAVYHDDKNGGYHWSLDYLYPENAIPLHRESLMSELGDGYALEDGQIFSCDIYLYPYSEYSDHYSPDHNSYYEPFLHYFEAGGRPRQHEVHLRKKTKFSLFESPPEPDKNASFDKLVATAGRIPGVSVVRAINSSIERLGDFYFLYDWCDIMETLDIDADHFVSASLILSLERPEEFVQFIEKLPQSVEYHFAFSRRFVIIPEYGWDGSESIHEWKFQLHPYQIRNSRVGREALNDYFQVLTAAIENVLAPQTPSKKAGGAKRQDARPKQAHADRSATRTTRGSASKPKPVPSAMKTKDKSKAGRTRTQTRPSRGGRR